MQNIVIVGGGAAAFKALDSILSAETNANVVLLSEERTIAYERPMLSKEMLMADVETIRYLPVKAGHANVEVHLQSKVVSINRQERMVVVQGGKEYHYHTLILATGSRPRMLDIPGTCHEDVHYVRNLDDARKLRAALLPGKRLIVIGGGFIGLEVAAAARQVGAKSIILEASDTLLARCGSSRLSETISQLHAQHGSLIQLASPVNRIEKQASGGFIVHCPGQKLEADLIVVGIGIVPNVELASECGLDVSNGIVVDDACRTSDDAILAAGEVTFYPVMNWGVSTRSECWTVALEQGAAAGRSALGFSDARYDEIPWLWSDQFGQCIQMWGLPQAASSQSMHELSNQRWIEVYWDDNKSIIGAIGYNANREIAELRRSARRKVDVSSKYRVVSHELEGADSQ